MNTRHSFRLALPTAFFFGSLGLALPAHAELDIPDKPLFQTSIGVAPNLIITLDDSASMMRSWIPQTLVTDQSFSRATIDGPRFKAPYFNGLYYDPLIKYEIPRRSDKPESFYTTSFNAAYFNGFDTSRGTINLATEYRVVGLSENSDDYSKCESMTYLKYNNWYGEDDCRLARNPGTMAAYSNDQTCTLYFDPLGGDDRITASGSSACDTLFTDIGPGAEVVIENVIDELEGTYLVSSAGDDWIEVGFDGEPYKDDGDITYDNEGSYSNVQVSWAYVDVGTPNEDDTHAYYYYYFEDIPGKAQPSACETPDRENDGCYVRVNVGSADDITSGTEIQQKQNFANWYSFYRNRGLVAMSGAMSSVSSLPEESVRLTWQGLLKCIGFDTSCPDTDGANHNSELRVLDQSHASSFFDWLGRMNITGGSTPLPKALISAGNLVKTNGAYWEEPNVSEGEVYSCRRNFHIMFTDGLWNRSESTPGGNSDIDSSGSFNLPDGKTYLPRAPYQDVNTGLSYENKNSLADIAMYFWGTDLNTSDDLVNDLTPFVIQRDSDEDVEYWNPKNNPATWQHLVNFPIGLGLSKSLTEYCYFESADLVPDPNSPADGGPGCPIWSDYSFGGDFDKIVAGERNWPKTGTDTMTNNEPDGRIYDLWHMAINSRGKFYSADDPEELVKSFQDAIDTVMAISSAGGGSSLGKNDNTLEEHPTVFHATFTPDWSGELAAKQIEDDGDFSEPRWEASERIPAGFNRNIVTLDASGQGTLFSPDICTDGGADSTIASLNKDSDGVEDGLCAERVQYLRGDVLIEDAVCEYDADDEAFYGLVTLAEAENVFTDGQVTVTGVEEPTGVSSAYFNGTFTVVEGDANGFKMALDNVVNCADVPSGSGGEVRYASFRERGTPLGDIIGSNPLYLGDMDNGYGVGSSGVNGASGYQSYRNTRRDAGPPTIYVGANDGMLHGFRADLNHPDSGLEILAYVPRGVYGNLSALTDPAYTHRFYVDGKIDIHDAYLGGGWGAYLAGGLGAGGRTIFALRLFSTAGTNPFDFRPEDVLWEFQNADLGLTFGKPQIRATAPSKWSVIFGNGYNSDSGDAALFAVDLDDETTFSKIIAISPVDNDDNGLSEPVLYDLGTDMIVDRAYAGDLHGNLWRFDNASGTWSLGNGGMPLFTAVSPDGEKQPITTAPYAVGHPDGGTLVVFGTGRNLTESDLTNDVQQTYYAIWDRQNVNEQVSTSELYALNLIWREETIGGETDSYGFTEPAFGEGASFDWFDGTSGMKGWRIDLPDSATDSPSMRVVINSVSLDEDLRVAEKSTAIRFTPNQPTADPCDFGGAAESCSVNLLSGRTEGPAFDINDDNIFDENDLVDDNDNTAPACIELEGYAVSEPIVVTEIEDVNDDGIDDIVTYLYYTNIEGKIEKVRVHVEYGTSEPPGGGSVDLERVYWRQIR